MSKTILDFNIFPEKGYVKIALITQENDEMPKHEVFFMPHLMVNYFVKSLAYHGDPLRHDKDHLKILKERRRNAFREMKLAEFTEDHPKKEEIYRLYTDLVKKLENELLMKEGVRD